ncbi:MULTISPECIES: tetratricopeptide repeat protein [Sphingomonas]|uniref:tetratricopeptide repeat protein n=1 Tax=Sphingomonas TaxID=13687 RepID=UPI00082F64C1|nr:tetratricopeptide repeat protein [Sphingomonas sp. CCH10-B3]
MLAGLALALPGAASAQADKKQTRNAPNIVTSPALPVVSAAPPPLRVLASVPLPDMPGTIAELVVVPDRAAIRFHDLRGDHYVAIDAVEPVLAMLADRRMMPLWPALIKWAGAGVETLRDDQIGVARRAFADAGPLNSLSPLSTAESSARPKGRALLRLATRLEAAGRRDEAIALLKANRPAKPGTTDSELFEWVAFAIRLSGIYREADDYGRAIAALDEATAAMGNERFYSVNLMINRAALLAESGRYGEALTAIDAARAAFGQSAAPGSSGDRVPGAGREFSWVRACALHGLGRIAEASAEAAEMLADTNPTDYQFVIKSTLTIAVRYALCVDDRRLAARVLASEAASRPAGGLAFELLQPARFRRAREARFFAAVRDEPALAELLRDRFRALPVEFTPALNRWYPTPVTPPPAH